MTGRFSPGRELAMYRTQGFRCQISVKALAGCGPSEERNEHTRNGISCKEWPTCYTTKDENAKGKSVFDFKDLHARNAASGQIQIIGHLSFFIRLSFVISHFFGHSNRRQARQMTNEKWQMVYDQCFSEKKREGPDDPPSSGRSKM